MPQHTELADEDLLAGEPLTAAKMLAIRDNILASSWHPYDDDQGIFWSFDIDGSASSFTTPDFEDGWEYRILIITHTTNATNYSIAPYQEATGGYASSVDFFAAGAGEYVALTIDLPHTRAARGGFVHRDSAGQMQQVAFTLTSDTILRARVSLSGGIPALSGTARLLKRYDALTA